MDLPHCYYVRNEIHEGAVPAVVKEEAFGNWDTASDLPKCHPPPGWSSNWALCTSLQNWVLPFPRWRTLSMDKAYHNRETWNRLLRVRLGSDGDISPIMYETKNHHFVIFRIAQRIYYFLRGPPGDPTEHRIRALPNSANDLSDPLQLAQLSRERWVSGHLSNRGTDSASSLFLGRTEECLKVLDYLETDAGRTELSGRRMSDDMRTWGLDDREELHRSAKNRWNISHTPMNIPEEESFDEDDWY